MTLFTAIRKILLLGQLADQPYSFENRRILLLNKIAVVATLILGAIVITHIFVGNLLQPIMVSMGFLVTIPTLWLQSRRQYKRARNWFLIGFFILISAVFFHSVQLNLATNTEYVMMIIIPLTLIFLDGKKSTFASLVIIFSGACYVVYRYIFSEADNPKELNGLVINWLTTSFTIYFCMGFFKRSLVSANQLIEKDRKQLAVANKTKNFLFGVISHDIRSPLNILKQYLLLDPSQRSDPDQFMIYQEGLIKKVDEIDLTLNDLLFWSKTQLQGIKVNPTAFHVREVAESIIPIVDDKLTEKQIDFTISESIGQHVWCDKDQLKVIIRNLVQNAIKFTPIGGKVSVSTQLENDAIRVTIEDTGKGMDEETLKNLREGMIVESNLGTAGEVGTGLGLSLVKQLIAKNNAKLEIDSAAGKGTAISVILPKAK